MARTYGVSIRRLNFVISRGTGLQNAAIAPVSLPRSEWVRVFTLTDGA